MPFALSLRAVLMVLSAGLVLAANITLNVPMQEPVLPSAIVATEEVLGGQIDPNTGTTYRIVGGYEAIPGMFPWLANENRECGATLIAKVQFIIGLTQIQHISAYSKFQHIYQSENFRCFKSWLYHWCPCLASTSQRQLL
mmetsp:Transcript_13744/g.26643  ORF Transcript_13744/g.26643 Transcript_13744/m.26643 type:complete len:140 (+) Transcript_13744:301-720(+)